MKEEYYSDVKWLITQKQWKTYEKLLQDERARLLSMFESGSASHLGVVQTQVMQTNKILNLPYDLVSEHEQELKENKK